MAGPYSEHGRIESRTRRIFRGEELIADKDKWGGNLTVIEILTSTEKKYDGKITSYFRFHQIAFLRMYELFVLLQVQHFY